MTAARRHKAVTSEPMQRRSDMAFLRQALAAQTPAEPFNPCAVAPHAGVPLWRFAHALCWEGHDKSAAGSGNRDGDVQQRFK